MIFVTPRIINYGESPETNGSLFQSQADQIKNEVKEDLKNGQNNNRSEAEIIADYLAERSKNREEILASIRADKKQAEFNDLNQEELEAILNK